MTGNNDTPPAEGLTFPRVLSVWREGDTYFRLVTRDHDNWCEVERCIQSKTSVRWEFDAYAPRMTEFYEEGL